jgi:hypothetical protein
MRRKTHHFLMTVSEAVERRKYIKKGVPLSPTSVTIHFFSKTVELPGASDCVWCCASSSRMESCVQD